jgi:hypothetical protein
MQVPGVSLYLARVSTLERSPEVALALPQPSESTWLSRLTPASREQRWLLPLTVGLLVALPVFLQAPWVRLHPASATAFTAVLLSAGVLLGWRGQSQWRELGGVLVGFSGSWLAGCLFWGWFRLHPAWHLPVEAFAVPIAWAGLSTRWRSAGAFYLASLLGTACTDGAMLLTGVMPLWPQVLQAPAHQAPELLRQAAALVLQPLALLEIAAIATGLIQLGRRWWLLGTSGQVAAAALITTLAVDGLFLSAALLSPHLSGLI